MVERKSHLPQYQAIANDLMQRFIQKNTLGILAGELFELYIET